LKFCPKCNRLMIPRRRENQTVLKCPACGHEEPIGQQRMAIVDSISSEKHHKIGVVKALRKAPSHEEREMFKEEYYSIFLETLAESESEESE